MPLSVTSPPPPLPREFQELLNIPKSGSISGRSPNLFGISVAKAQPQPRPPTTDVPSENTPPDVAAGSTADRPKVQLTEEQREDLRRYLKSQQEYQKEQQKYYERWSW